MSPDSETPTLGSLALVCVEQIRASTPQLSDRWANQTVDWASVRAEKRPDDLWVVAVDRHDATPGLANPDGTYLAVLDLNSTGLLRSGGELEPVTATAFQQWVNGREPLGVGQE